MKMKIISLFLLTGCAGPFVHPQVENQQLVKMEANCKRPHEIFLERYRSRSWYCASYTTQSAKDCLDSSWWQVEGRPEELEDHHHDEIIFGDQVAAAKTILKCRSQ